MSSGLIDRLERRVGGVRAGSSSFVWRLTAAGGRILGESVSRQPHEPSPRHLTHVLAVAEVVTKLHEAARAGSLEIVAIETEPTCWRQFAAAHGGREWLKPDLRVTVAVGSKEFHWWVEVDRATEHRPTVRRKAKAYLRAWREGGEQRRTGVWPRTLWLAPDNERRRVIEAVVDAVGAPSGMVLCATDESAVPALGGGRP